MAASPTPVPQVSTRSLRLLAAVACALLVSGLEAGAQSRGEPPRPPMELVAREGESDVYNVRGGDSAMNAAIARARATLGTFHKYADKAGSGRGFAMIKGRFASGQAIEHIWVEGVRWDGSRYHGRLNNEPLRLNGLHRGDPVAITPEQVSDWMVVVDGVLLGGFTNLEIRRRLPPGERASFDADRGYRIVADTALLRLPQP